jgi:uncharacterized protein YecA (UPF0149 family)
MASAPISLENSALSSAQGNAIANLAAGRTIVSSAEQAGVSRATIHNWLKLPGFQAALDQARQDFAAQIQAKLYEITALALDTIRHTLTDPAISPAVKLKAALAVIDRPLFPKPAAKPAAAEPAAAEPAAAEPAAAEPEEIPKAPLQPAVVLSDTARNAPCPCGSGNKYKRCCGTHAPPQLGRAA